MHRTRERGAGGEAVSNRANINRDRFIYSAATAKWAGCSESNVFGQLAGFISGWGIRASGSQHGMQGHSNPARAPRRQEPSLAAFVPYGPRRGNQGKITAQVQRNPISSQTSVSTKESCASSRGRTQYLLLWCRKTSTSISSIHHMIKQHEFCYPQNGSSEHVFCGVHLSTYLLSRLVEHLALSRQRLRPIHQIVNLLSTLQHRFDRFMLLPWWRQQP